MKIFKRILILTAILLVLLQVPFSCAQRGRPTGGPKDTIPPVVMSTKPANFTTRFKAKNIRINFDEYIKLKDPSTQILISPPLKTPPIIKPQGQAMKYVDIEFLDSLKPNTTYTINFGQSIEDNNEGNPLSFYKYVFSTGDYIDSLQLSGSVKDAIKRETDDYISILFYRLDENFSDSIVYKRPPDYVASTQDTTHTFQLENMPEGAYKIVALKDKNNNYLFDRRSDKIGFLEDTIHLPTDREYNLTIFREPLPYKPAKPIQKSLQHLLFGFEGSAKDVEIRMLSDKPTDFAEAYYKRKDSDSIDYWFRPYFEADSVIFQVSKGERVDSLIVRLKEIEKDSMKIKPEPTSNLSFLEDFALSSNTPIQSFNSEGVSIMNKDSMQVPFEVDFKKEYNKVFFKFDKEEQQVYRFRALPGTIKDLYGKENDTLNYTLKTKAETDFADVILNVENIDRYPVILQMVDSKGKMQREMIHDSEDGNRFHFEFVEPGSYYIRLIYDDNANGKWDTGNYLERRQPEKVIYMKKPLEVRKNWEISQTFILME